MRDISIRWKILVWVILVNLVGAVTVGVYLHQTFSGGLDVASRDGVRLSKSTWEDIVSHTGKPANFANLVTQGPGLTERMKKITGSEYGLLLAKTEGDQKSYAAARAAANLADNWDEQKTYVLVGSTDEALADKMQLQTAPEGVPEMGKLVGIENGACSKTCHGGVKGEGEFWGVSWSNDDKSRAYAVVPILDAGGKPIGLVYSVKDISAQADSDRASLIRTLLVIAGGLIAATVLIGFLLHALVFNRLTKMIEAMEDISVRVAGGDFDAHFEPDGTDDEIGQFEQFFARLMDLIAGTLKSVMKAS
jgi:methyl-accepting chemotaxis protein